MTEPLSSIWVVTFITLAGAVPGAFIGVVAYALGAAIGARQKKEADYPQ